MFGSLFGAANQGRTARDAVAGGALLLDVRTPEEFAGGHLPNALNVPLQVLPGRVADLAAKHPRIVVYCRSGGRSAQAAGLLRAAGVEVVDLGPMSAWNS